MTDELSALYSEMLAAEAKETASTSGSRVVTRPADFLAALREANPMFQGSWQQDAQELLRYVCKLTLPVRIWCEVQVALGIR